MKIDCHTHTTRFSGCAVISPDELFEAASDQGLDAVVLTEHDSFWPREDIRWLRRAYPDLKIFGGVEVSCGPDHVVVLLPEPEPEVIKYEDRAKLWQAVRDLGGYAFVAHPFRFVTDFARKNPAYDLPALEVVSSNMPGGDAVRKSLDYARKMEARPIAASDAHGPRPVGDYYIRLPASPATAAELVEALRESDFSPVAPAIKNTNLE